MKKKLSFLLALVFVLTLAFSVLPGMPAQAALSDYSAPAAVPNSDLTSFSYSGYNFFYIKQSTYAFVWVDSTVPSSLYTEIRQLVDSMESSVSLSSVYLTTDTDFYLYSKAGLNITDGSASNLFFRVVVNTTTKNVTITNYEKYKDSYNHWNLRVATSPAKVSHINLFKYDPLTFGKLKVMKNVSGTGASTTQEFTISLVFTIGSKGSLSDIQFDSKSSGASYSGSNGSYTLTLADDEFVSFKNIPVGTTYTVSETVSLTGWTGPSNSTGSIADTTQKLVTVENVYTPVGSLEIKKDVETSGAPSGVQFPIFVQFTGDTTGMVVPSGVTSLGSGKYSLSLANYSSSLNNSKVFTNIPYNVTYTVSEGALLPGWYNDNESGELSGTINSASKIVEVENKYHTPDVGSLKIVKALAEGSDQYQTSPSFTINVQFTKTNTDLSALQYQTSGSGVTVTNLSSATNGLYQITLQIGQWVNFTNVPKNATYSVSEVTPLPTNWSITQPDDIINNDTIPPYNTIDSNGDDDTVTVYNTYKVPVVPSTGTLTVNKIVENYDSSDTYAIDVTFTNETGLAGLTPPTGTPGTSADKTLTYTVSLAGGGSIQFTGIPLGTNYTVDETAALSNDWTITGEVLTAKPITQNSTETITNTYNHQETPGSLTVTKQVVGTETSQTFAIDVTFFGSNLDFSGPDVSTEYGDGSVTYKLQLQGGQTISFTGIPAGTTYTVVETEQLSNDWKTTGQVTTATPISSESSVTIVNTFGSDEPTPTPTPTPAPTPTPVINYGSLTVSKTVTAGAATNDKFDITVTFTPGAPDFWNVLGISAPAGATGGNGVYTLRLSANDGPVTFSNIPVGTTYTVVEEPIKAELTAKGWTAGTISNATGTITTAGSSAVVSNVFTTPGQVAGASDNGSAVAGDTDKLPQTGGISTSTLIGLFGLALIAIGGTTIAIFRKKNDGKSN